MLFAASAIVVMGFVGLASEAGTWYLGRRMAQDAADSAAVSAALASFYGSDPIATGRKIAASNGFTSGDTVHVDVEVLPASGTNPNAPVRVTVSQDMAPLISALFTKTRVTVGAQSQAVVAPIGKACALATQGSLVVTGVVYAPGCILASNATTRTAIDIQAGANVLAITATAVGGCCGDGALTLDPGRSRPPSPYHPQTINPFSAADTTVLPSFDPASQCDSIPAAVSAVITLEPYETTGHAYCGTGPTDALTVDTGTTVHAPPGTYFFWNLSLKVTDGGSIRCSDAVCAPGSGAGTTFVFVGTAGNIGTVNIDGGTVNLIPVANNATFPGLSGILFYGRGLVTAYIHQEPAGGTLTQPIYGGVYFPNSALSFNVNLPSTCLSVVAQSITLWGEQQMDATDCQSANTALAIVQGVHIVQ